MRVANPIRPSRETAPPPRPARSNGPATDATLGSRRTSASMRSTRARVGGAASVPCRARRTIWSTSPDCAGNSRFSRSAAVCDWFNVKSFPDIIFRSQRLEFNDERPVAVDGVLIMLGEIRPMRLEISRFKCGLNLALRKRGCGADAQGVLRRSDYGMLTGLPFIGDEVRLRIQVEAYLP